MSMSRRKTSGATPCHTYEKNKYVAKACAITGILAFFDCKAADLIPEVMVGTFLMLLPPQVVPLCGLPFTGQFFKKKNSSSKEVLQHGSFPWCALLRNRLVQDGLQRAHLLLPGLLLGLQRNML